MPITYLFDPLCGWCYGASPVLERLARLHGVAVELAPTGLFAGPAARAMDPQFAAFAWQNDQRIARLTGQPFTEDYRTRILGRIGSLFDSAPATLGVIAVGLTDPSREIEALQALQRARYVDGRDNASLEGVAEILDDAGFAAAASRVRAPDAELLAAYRRRIEAARADMSRFGADGVPALVIGDGAKRGLLPGNFLFGNFDVLQAWLQAA